MAGIPALVLADSHTWLMAVKSFTNHAGESVVATSGSRQIRKQGQFGKGFLPLACAALIIFTAMTGCTKSPPATTPNLPTTVPVLPQQAVGAGQLANPVLKVEFTNAAYQIAPGGTSGFFKTGQSADILLSGIDFNNTGGPLLFNHPSEIGRAHV